MILATVEKKKNVTIEDDQIIINDYHTKDKDIVTYFNNLSESENPDEKFESALKVGVIATRTVSTAENVDYVEKSFNKLTNEFDKKIENIFGDKGQFSELLENHFGEDGYMIKEIMNPSKEGSPLHLVKNDLMKMMNEIKEHLIASEAQKEIISKTTKKGAKFEEYCEPILSGIARVYGDQLEETGNIIGEISKCKKGDFVITIKDIQKKIVLEMKDYGKLSRPQINEELDIGIKNRKADYAILVAKSQESLPSDIGWFNEIEDKKLVCAIGDHEDGELHTEILLIAYKWARTKLLIETTKHQKVDANIIKDKVKSIEKKLHELNQVKLQCTNIDNASEKIKTISDTVKEEIEQELEEIQKSLT